MPPSNTWKPYNVQAIIRNVELVFKTSSIEKLNQPTYKFITLHMGFIAHYDLYGFQAHYQDLRDFCAKLQTSEYSRDEDYNLREADRYEHRQEFGAAYNHSISQAIRGLVAVARKYAGKINAIFAQLEMERDLTQVKRILVKYGLSNFDLNLKEHS
ncbi:MAG: hypothetical protein MN733_17105 [Nitrososphaera sp.]|nr:hypothetical protein [Nitrososphaera sp.]